MQLALSVQLSTIHGDNPLKCAYISTDRTFPFGRLDQLNAHYQCKYGKHIDFKENVYVFHVSDIVCSVNIDNNFTIN